MCAGSIPQKFRPKAKTHRQIASGGGFRNLLKIALLHPIPSSRRHVIRVDMPVLVDVIRVAFWLMEFIDDDSNNARQEYRTTIS